VARQRTSDPPSDREILRKIEQQPKSTAKYKQLVREFGIRGGQERRELGERLTKLVKRGELLAVPGDRYAIPKAANNRNSLVGRLSMHRDGYGFVTPEDGAPRGLAGDIFINPREIGDAMHGDRVMVDLTSVRPDGRGEGRILRVIGRAHETVVGTFHYGDRYNFVRPIDEKITLDIIIPKGQEKPLTTEGAEGREHKKALHRVIGDEARQHSKWDDLQGVVVDVEITDWPTPTQNPRGRVVEVLGYEDDFGVDVEIIIRKFHIPHRFPADVIDEAQAIEPMISSAELRGRRDYRKQPIVTIDGETARDFDDAVLVRKLENGNYELQVHIADVGHYVTDGSSLDQEARLRGTSVYFPDRAVPMLPLELSTDICSLRPHLDRLVMSCVMEIDHQGEIVGYELHPGVIRSAERMTYTAVNAVLEGDKSVRERYHSLVPSFELMRELAGILNRKRQRRGSIDFDLPEPVIEFEEGLMVGVTRTERNWAHRLIEEFMLSANESVASYLEGKGVPSLYRIHEKPDPKKVYDFETIAASFGYSLGVGPLPIRRVQMKADRRERYGSGRRAPTVELPEDVHITPRMYQKLVQKIEGKPEERILSYLMLRSLKQARYSEVNEGHFALAAPTYTHFTSPIRRYPDLIVHRILKQALASEDGGGRGAPAHSETPGPWSKRSTVDRRPSTAKPSSDGHQQGPIDLDELHDIAESSSDTERRADEAERELIEWKKVKFMQDKVGEEFDGLVISVTKFGFFVELMDMFIEGLVPLATLTDDRYTYRENTKQIVGERSRKTYSLGQRVRVLVDRIDPVQHKINFSVVEPESSRAQKRHRKQR